MVLIGFLYSANIKFFPGQPLLSRFSVGGQIYFNRYLLFLLLLMVFVISLGMSLKQIGADSTYYMANIRKLAETPRVLPYSPLIDNKFVNYTYSYNLWLLFVSVFSRFGNVDSLYVWNSMVGLALVYTIAAVYTFVKLLLNNIPAAIFVSILFPYILFNGNVKSVFANTIISGNVANPSYIIYAMTFMQVGYLYKAVKQPCLRTILIVVCGSLVLFTIHGQGILIYTIIFATLSVCSFLFPQKKFLLTKLLIIIGLATVLINMPYLYIAKLQSAKDFIYYRNTIDIKEFWGGTRFFRRLIELPNSLYIVSPNLYLKHYGWLAFVGILLVWLKTKDKFRTLFVFSCIFSVPLFLSNPYFVTYGNKYLSMHQIQRLGAHGPLIKAMLLLSVYILIDYFSKYIDGIRQRKSQKPLHESTKTIIIKLIVLFLIIKNAYPVYKTYREFYAGKGKKYHWRKILNSDFTRILRTEIAPGSTVFTANRTFFPIAVPSNNYVTFAGSQSMHVSISPRGIAQKQYEDGKLAEQYLMDEQFDNFFNLVKEYQSEYVLLRRWQRKKIKKSDLFKKSLQEMTNYNDWYLYRVKNNMEVSL